MSKAISRLLHPGALTGEQLIRRWRDVEMFDFHIRPKIYDDRDTYRASLSSGEI